MRWFAFATLGAGLSAAILMLVGIVGVTHPDDALARYPRSLSMHEQFDLLSAPKGYVTHRRVFQTDDDVITVLRWFDGQFGLQPAEGIHVEGECLLLTKTNQHLFLRRTIEVTLCSRAPLTMVTVSQAVYLAPY